MAQVANHSRTFKDYHLALRSCLLDDDFDRFKRLSTNREKIIFINDLKNRPTFPITRRVNCGKNIEEARKLKEKGNVFFQKEKYNEACWFYSQSILKSSVNCAESKDEVAVYFANRSAALYHLKEFELAINDIDFALNNNYPKHLSHKLLDRKARCLLALEEHQRASDVFKKTIQALDDAKLPLQKKQKWQKDIQIMLLMMSKNQQSQDGKISVSKSTSKFDDEWIEGKSNNKYEAITSAIEIKYTDRTGRFAEAKEDLKAGQVVLVEDSHCAVLLQKYQFTNCYHCFRRVKAFHACPSCDRVIFCSLTCTEAAMKYHKVECPVLETIWGSEVSVTCHMSFRIIAQQPLDYFISKKQHLKRNDQKEISKYTSSDYETIFNLVSHEEKRKPEDLLNRIHMALFLLNCLKVGGYFGKYESEKNLSNDEIFIAELLLHHLQISQFNSHEVSELHVENDDLINSSSNFIGGALYPSLALFNHSCNPAVIRYFKGTKVITRTIRSIKKGEMVAENYGPIFTDSKKTERQRVLKERYWFDCACEACLDDWPTMSDMLTEENIRFKCTNKQCQSLIPVNPNANSFLFNCKKCSQNINILKALKSLQETDQKFNVAQTLLKLKKVDQVLEITLRVLRILEETLVPPFKDYYLCAQIIRTCFLSKGNVYLKRA